ncbi:MAG: PqqD family protein [Actinomycetota bacterium]
MPISYGAAAVMDRLPRRKSLPSQRVQGELLVEDPATAIVHFLNPSAAFIWEACDGETSAAMCAERLRSAFTVPEEVDLARDIRDTVLDFRRRGILE